MGHCPRCAALNAYSRTLLSGLAPHRPDQLRHFEKLTQWHSGAIPSVRKGSTINGETVTNAAGVIRKYFGASVYNKVVSEPRTESMDT